MRRAYFPFVILTNIKVKGVAMFIIGLIIFGIPSAIIAGTKGFKHFRWLIAFGLLGLIVVVSLASAKAKEISLEEASLRAQKADNIGGWMAGLNLGLGFLITLVSLSMTN